MKIVKIRPLTSSQVPEILELDQICLGGLWTAEGYLREIDSPSSSLIALSIHNYEQKNYESKIVGLACLWSIVEEAHITLLAVAPEYRRQGLGELLLLTLLDDAIARKLAWATLEVNVNNTKAISLYQKFGFQVAGTRKGYYQKTGEDALILWLKGLQSREFRLNLAQWQVSLSDRLGQNQYQIKSII